MVERMLGQQIPIGKARLTGDLFVPLQPRGIVVFAHGSGSSRHSPRNKMVASVLQEASLATLLTDLLTEDEETLDIKTAEFRFDIGLLARRLAGAIDWVRDQCMVGDLLVGCFGASTGAAAAMIAAAERPDDVAAVVSRGGRPDLAGAALSQVKAPTLLIVGDEDDPVLQLNRQASAQLQCEKRLEIVPGATHLFQEPGALDEVARLASEWLVEHLGRREDRTSAA